MHPHARILDIGCGRGGLIELLHDRAALITGVDPDQHSLLEHRIPDLRRVSGCTERLPFADESFDLILCSWVLEHLAHPTRAFSEVARVLHDAGHFVFLTPNALHPLIWAGRLMGRFGNWQAQIVARLYGRADADTFPVVYRANTRRQLIPLATEAGLEPVALYGIGDPTYLAFNELFFHVATVAESLTPAWMKVHLVGDFVKAERGSENGDTASSLVPVRTPWKERP